MKPRIDYRAAFAVLCLSLSIGMLIGLMLGVIGMGMVRIKEVTAAAVALSVVCGSMIGAVLMLLVLWIVASYAKPEREVTRRAVITGERNNGA